MEFYIQFQKEDREILKAFKSMETFADIASFFEVPKKTLWKIIYKEKHYEVFNIRKKRFIEGEDDKNNYRQINSPCKNIKILQRKLKYCLELLYHYNPSIHGFVKDRSIVSNANSHLMSKTILNIDLKDFFPSIHQKRVYGVFRYYFKKNNLVSGVLTELCTYEECLPQGAPTSPVLSNIICRNLDVSFRNVCRRYNCIYTRYVDDITISTKKSIIPEQIGIQKEEYFELDADLVSIIEKEGFILNHKKTRLQTSRERQVVTGIKVNEKLNVNRNYVLSIRAMLHNFEVLDRKAAKEKFYKHYKPHDKRTGNSRLEPEEVIRGMINYVAQIKGKTDPVVQKFIQKFNALEKPDKIKNISPLSQIERDFMHSIYRIDVEYFTYCEEIGKETNPVEELYNPLKEQLLSEFAFQRKRHTMQKTADKQQKFKLITDEEKMNIFDVDVDFFKSEVGTGFLLKNGKIITCAHVFKSLIKTSEKYNLYDAFINVRCIDPFTGENTLRQEIEIESINFEIDIAICKFVTNESIIGLEKNTKFLSKGKSVKLLGFPSHQNGSFIEASGVIIGVDHEKLTKGIFNKKKKNVVDVVELYIINETIFEGNSGGPVLNENNEVIGIAARGTTSTSIVGNKVIPIDYLDSFHFDKVELEKMKYSE
ncbi:reverse transcriptase domain-containing protein [Enterococcus sp. 5H]|uniref:reverse transcriptase domain-containing protein n=1 Tax=Enterococcus sp. 5H TaxID=1229490 RepID=UPI0023026162|nr:reverse transcriptase domain-containing protein [Enterococcus sp. 5H]MDA9470913.1 RNA-directed DNA polymerase from retron ec67 [Enterococcus sp. 5H]